MEAGVEVCVVVHDKPVVEACATVMLLISVELMGRPHRRISVLISNSLGVIFLTTHK